MTGATRERSHTTRPASWDSAPVAAGGRRGGTAWILVAGLLVALAALAAVVALSGDRALRRAQEPPVPAAADGAFDVTVRVTDVVPMDDDAVFGRPPAVAGDTAVDAAARDIAGVVARYPDTAFVAPGTRFSDQSLRVLLDPRALAAARATDRRGLGVVDVAVRDVEPRPVRVGARLVTDGGEVVLAAVRYDARAELVTTDGASGPLHQRARMVLVRERGGWRADVVEAELSLPAAEADR